ncbi:MAG: hypothetical protein U0941_23670 [Planctomycetaceae bacterium]
MNLWTIAPLLVGLSLLMIVFTYCACVTIVKMDQILPRWARQHGFRIIHSEVQTLFSGPFSVNRYAPVYRITVEDQERRQKKGWVRLGVWYIVGFRENIEVCWDE